MNIELEKGTHFLTLMTMSSRLLITFLGGLGGWGVGVGGGGVHPESDSFAVAGTSQGVPYLEFS